MTVALLAFLVLFLFISEIVGEFHPLIKPDFRIAGGIVAFLLLVWIFASISAGEQILP